MIILSLQHREIPSDDQYIRFYVFFYILKLFMCVYGSVYERERERERERREREREERRERERGRGKDLNGKKVHI